ncbi:bifunctional diaminohydroxyphosphoribosylaminopyrimidine deaminase/5-amino-6-(5-phosphoribosylamino)uracil reductase RibD [Litorilituus sediminis]|uniref:Riboflavin biosynthesis protein RibD n=1 Tax=Litorilituus sediminis TaxID=718192 RepID=A0A4P6PD87_9GAMM|nr:bifunctional diaminohydroxyphosphoribosylaminopyrimidine deaminase/5-amino-6-(5-phosphoribosylamino)uracil reductase RibD [Litorilituus sediminis]QBG37755.1 bifunctional diaminohydroxyphosphoribosylaminopyrimidine deaminase/5-amino-6-(5-phosphoribosylamino)uracil reductase RibD [Litorilituus sediminis]
MALAIELAKKGHYTTSPNPRVGCVLVNNNQIIGQGFHAKAGLAHAEVNALAEAKKHYPELIQGATAYVTLEPCSHTGRTPPCAQKLIDAKVARVVSAMVDPNPKVSGRGLKMLSDQGIVAQSGLLAAEASLLNVGFIKRMTVKVPYVRCKLAASLDGKTAMQSGESKWITANEAREDVQRLRAQSCAVIAGADSVLFDNAKMNLRWSQLGYLAKTYPENKLRQPLRVIIDSQHRLTPSLELFKQESPILIVQTFAETHLENQQQWPHFVEHIQVKATYDNKVCLRELLAVLAKREINEVLIESGAKLAGAFIEQDLVDELILYQAGKLIGGDGKNLVEMPSIQSLSQAKQLKINDVRMLGRDIKITAKFERE